MKFGGSSVADAACMREVAALVSQALPSAPLVVLSATARTTDGLLQAAHRAEAGDLEAALELSRSIQLRHRAIALELFPGHHPAVLAGFGTVGVARDRTIVAIVGERPKSPPGVTGHCFGALTGINVEMISMGAHDLNLSFVVKREDAEPALRALPAALIEGVQGAAENLPLKRGLAGFHPMDIPRSA